MGGGGGSSGGLSGIGQQQANANTSSAIAQQELNMVNQSTPYGSLTYSRTGDGNWINGTWVPQYQATETLSPGQQGLLDSSTQAQQGGLNLINNTLLPNLQNAATATGNLGTSQDLFNNAYNSLFARSSQALNTQIDQQKTQLANQGIMPGTTAYDNALRPFTQALTDAGNQAYSGAEGIATQDLGNQININNQPFNQFSSLLGLTGSTTNPSSTYANTPQTSVQAADYESPAIAQYQANTASNNAMTGGLFGLAGSALGAGAFVL